MAVIALFPASWGCYVLDVCADEDIPSGAIKLLNVDYECSGSEAIQLCYGIRDGYISHHTSYIPAFVMPFYECKNPNKFLSNKYSIIGHMKYCLEQAYQAQREDHKERFEAIRCEAIENFRGKDKIKIL